MCTNRYTHIVCLRGVIISWMTFHNIWRFVRCDWSLTYATPDKELYGEQQLQVQKQLFTRSRRGCSSCPHEMRKTRVSWFYYEMGAKSCAFIQIFCLEGYCMSIRYFFSMTIMLALTGYPVHMYTSMCLNLSGEKFFHIWSRRWNCTNSWANLQQIHTNRTLNHRNGSTDKNLSGIV